MVFFYGKRHPAKGKLSRSLDSTVDEELSLPSLRLYCTEMLVPKEIQYELAKRNGQVS